MKVLSTKFPDGRKIIIPTYLITSIYEYFDYDEIPDGEPEQIVDKLTLWDRIYNIFGANIQPSITYKQNYIHRYKKVALITTKDDHFTVVSNMDEYQNQMDSL